MKHLILEGVGENARKADLLYWHLLNFYPRESWTFRVKTIRPGVPMYEFGLKGPAEKVTRELKTIFA